MTKLIQCLVLAALSLALSALSVLVEQTGPDSAQYGNLCGARSNDPCIKQVLKGGFPVPFLFDQPGVSIERQLFFGEDIFHKVAFATNTALYFLAIGFFAYVMRKRRKENAVVLPAPDPSIERTLPGKPVSASHVKR